MALSSRPLAALGETESEGGLAAVVAALGVSSLKAAVGIFGAVCSAGSAYGLGSAVTLGESDVSSTGGALGFEATRGGALTVGALTTTCAVSTGLLGAGDCTGCALAVAALGVADAVGVATTSAVGAGVGATATFAGGASTAGARAAAAASEL